MSAPSLQSKTIRAAAWTASEQVGRRIFQFITGIILARILLPEEFGLMGVLTVFMIVAQVFADSGLSSALIQNQNSTSTDHSTAFYLNVVFSILVCAILCLISPYVAAAFKEPKLQPLMCVLSLVVVINSLGSVHAALFARSIDFRPMTTAILVSMGLSGITGITLALCGYGVWSLIIQRLVSDSLRVILFWRLSSWRPSFEFSVKSMIFQLRFGSAVLATAICNTLAQPLYYLVIAKYYSPALLGYVTQGTQLPDALSKTLGGLVNRVAFPVFSSIQNDKERVKRGLQRAIKIIYSTVLPLMVALAAVAPNLVSILLTDKWLPSVPYLRLMCAIGFVMPVQTLFQHFLMADGRTKLLVKTQLSRIILHAIIVASTFRFGIIPILCGQIVVEIFVSALLGYVTGRIICYPFIQQVRDSLPSVATSLVMFLTMSFVGRLCGSNTLVCLACEVSAGLLIFGTMGVHLQLGPFEEAKRLLDKTSGRSSQFTSSPSSDEELFRRRAAE